jgi:hypothetical protein
MEFDRACPETIAAPIAAEIAAMCTTAGSSPTERPGRQA